eukprot:TRINITY_DN7116_c0_g1_i5.p2 TRINITY_DN7116_c0_g1~~TRINITY_DN7116_c0_g1_i5.p2  ORF type:complete len:147 (-),score=19.25 TRINITY_DN7116_c0_g1_i5:108-548(-)
MGTYFFLDEAKRIVGYVPTFSLSGQSRIVFMSSNGTKIASAAKHLGTWYAEVLDNLGGFFTPVDFSVIVHLYEWNESEHPNDTCTSFLTITLPVLIVVAIFLTIGISYVWYKCKQCSTTETPSTDEETLPLMKAIKQKMIPQVERV